MRVLVEKHKQSNTRYEAGQTDGLPDDGWLASVGVNPSSVIDRKIMMKKGEKFWLVSLDPNN